MREKLEAQIKEAFIRLDKSGIGRIIDPTQSRIIMYDDLALGHIDDNLIEVRMVKNSSGDYSYNFIDLSERDTESVRFINISLDEFVDYMFKSLTNKTYLAVSITRNGSLSSNNLSHNISYVDDNKNSFNLNHLSFTGMMDILWQLHDNYRIKAGQNKNVS